jgi:probable DNA metabolism protein
MLPISHIHIPKNTVYLYDGSFDGFLTVVFDIYAYKREPLMIMSEYEWQPGLFEQPLSIITEVAKSQRVWNGIIKQANKQVARMFFLVFSSQLPNIEMTLYGYLQKLFADKSGNYYKNILDDHSFELYRIYRKVSFEIHRFKGFVRFQQTADGLLFAAIEPDHDIVCLLAPHFAKRFGNQQWMIYDQKREKGVFFDKQGVHQITLTDKQLNTISGEIVEDIKASGENIYRSLWKTYYKAINIPERKNIRLMLRLLPRRYWKYMPEKED